MLGLTKFTVSSFSAALNKLTLSTFSKDIQQDIEVINRISVVANILDAICRNTGMGFAAVARVTDDKWVALATKDNINFGLLPGDELKLETTICHEISHHHEAVVIDHVKEDERYANHHTPLMYGFQSYISVPIILKNGSFFGTLCAIDPNPANLTNAGVLQMFTLFADLISFHINATEELRVVKLDLVEEKRVAEMREQFIAVLGHDLRNPVNAISNSADILKEIPDEKTIGRLASIIHNSTYRIKELIENILDFARGRLGGGITINQNIDVPIEAVIHQLVSEVNAIYPQATIDTRFHLFAPVHCDTSQLAQLLSNLLNNAINHGDSSKPILLQVESNSERFSLSVCNSGKVIPNEVLARIFQPFYRGGDKNKTKGLGLGLFIASEIARAHGGTLTASSDENSTCFTFELPQSDKG